MGENGDNIKQFRSPEGLLQKREARDYLGRLVQFIEKLERDPTSGTMPLTNENLLELSALKGAVQFFLSGLMERPYDGKFRADFSDLNVRIATSALIDCLTDEEFEELGWIPGGGPFSA